MVIHHILVFTVSICIGFVLGYILAMITANKGMMKKLLEMKAKYAELNDEWRSFQQDMVEAIKKIEDESDDCR